MNYQYAPAASVDSAFAHAIDPSGLNPTAHSDPQQTISVGMSQNIEAKLKPPPGDTTGQGRKIKLLSLNTSQVQYNFERAKQSPLLTGWQTQSLTNTMSSDLIPGFSLSLTHDLWNGPVGYKVAKFSPFLTNVSASFSISEATIRGIGGLLGLGGGNAKQPPPAPGAANAGLAGANGQNVGISGPGLPPPTLGGGIPGISPFAGPTGGGFSMSVTFTSTRFRPIKDSSIFAPVQTDTQYQGQLPVTPVPGFLPQTGAGQEQINVTTHFSPTPHWDLNWTTTYDFHTRQFGQQFISLQRDLRRWRASFQFVKSPNGNFGFNFTIQLKDEQDIKFDYDQQTFRQTQ